MKILFECASKTEYIGRSYNPNVSSEIVREKYWSYEFDVSPEGENVLLWKQLPVGSMKLSFIHTLDSLFEVGEKYYFEVSERL